MKYLSQLISNGEFLMSKRQLIIFSSRSSIFNKIHYTRDYFRLQLFLYENGNHIRIKIIIITFLLPSSTLCCCCLILSRLFKSLSYTSIHGCCNVIYTRIIIIFFAFIQAHKIKLNPCKHLMLNHVEIYICF